MSCNVLGHRHYWNWASPCVSPYFGNAHGLKSSVTLTKICSNMVGVLAHHHPCHKDYHSFLKTKGKGMKERQCSTSTIRVYLVMCLGIWTSMKESTKSILCETT